MLILKAYAVTDLKSGKQKVYNMKIVEKMENDVFYSTDYDLLEPKQARKWLRDIYRLPNGKKLPFETEFGEPIVYVLYFFGVPHELYDTARYYSGGKIGSILNLFPGYEKEQDKNGKTPVRDYIRYGSIR